MNKKKSKVVVLTVSICCLLVVGLFFAHNMTLDVLSEADIAALREEYPITANNYDPGALVNPLDLSKVKELYDTFIYGQVVEGPQKKTLTTPQGIQNLIRNWRQME